MTLKLNAEDKALLSGDAGEGAASAMRILAAFSEAIGAETLLPISGAHIDGCLYHGAANVDFVERLLEGNARCAFHDPQCRVARSHSPGDHADQHGGRLAAQEADGGARGAWVPAVLHMRAVSDPLPSSLRRPGGMGESNAIVFANSVIGARTNPVWGLH